MRSILWKVFLVLILISELSLLLLLFLEITGSPFSFKKSPELDKEEPTSQVSPEPKNEKKPAPDFSLLKWEPATLSAPWSKRDVHTAVVFKDKMWILGGLGEGIPEYGLKYHKKDIWVSENGNDWQQVSDSAPWGERRSHASVVFKDKLWVLGGFEAKSVQHKNDVWYSEDGINWTEATKSADPASGGARWSPRRGHSAVVFQDKIWLMAGVDDETGAKNDVWYSEDGISWSLATAKAPWSKRYDQTALAFGNKIFLIGGVFPGEPGESDIWVSDNGRDWELLTDNPPWQGRHGHCSLSYQDKIWILGGWDGIGKGFNDVWYSEDGKDWQKTSINGPWNGREDHACFVLADKMWITGGMTTSRARTNDVWYSLMPEGLF